MQTAFNDAYLLPSMSLLLCYDRWKKIMWNYNLSMSAFSFCTLSGSAYAVLKYGIMVCSHVARGHTPIRRPSLCFALRLIVINFGCVHCNSQKIVASYSVTPSSPTPSMRSIYQSSLRYFCLHALCAFFH
jgi:hypothetical protein